MVKQVHQLTNLHWKYKQVKVQPVIFVCLESPFQMCQRTIGFRCLHEIASVCSCLSHHTVARIDQLEQVEELLRFLAGKVSW